MVKRLFDVFGSFALLIISTPLFGCAAVGIKLSSRGPVFYRARRVGLDGCIFSLLKLRTMRIDNTCSASRITAARDDRVFAIGRLLRFLKIDELPQLINILRGEMSFVGPRPEDPQIVQDHYGPAEMRTLDVRPGLAGVGSIFNYTHGDRWLSRPNPELVYANELLPVKLALEGVYLRRASFAYDMSLIGRTLLVICLKMLGKKQFALPPEWAELPSTAPIAEQAA